MPGERVLVLSAVSKGLSYTESCLSGRFRHGCVIWQLCRQEAKKRCKEVTGS